MQNVRCWDFRELGKRKRLQPMRAGKALDREWLCRLHIM
jgi:hypothetical protein